MDSILASYTDKARSRGDGRTNKSCPVCGSIVFEQDITSFFPDAGDSQIDLCADCCDTAELDLEVKFESDVLEPDLYARLHAWCEENKWDKTDCVAHRACGNSEEGAELR